MARIVFEVDVDGPDRRLLDALTTRDGIAAWWTDDVEFAGGVGAVMRLGFPVAPLPFELRVEEAGPKRVRWASVGEFPPHWQGTEVVWTPAPKPDGDGAVVHFAHDGWAGDDGPLPMAAFTWGQLLVALKRFVETGEAAPMFRRV